MPPTAQHRARDLIRFVLKRGSVLVTVWIYLLLAPMGFVLFALLTFLWRKDPLRRAWRLQRLTAFAYRVMHDWLWLVRVTRFNHRRRIEGLPSGPCVVIANHPTLMDITSIMAVLGDGCTIVKPELWDRRLLHGMLVACGNMKGPGTDLVSIQRVVDEAVERLSQGFRLVVFPEGTRSRNGELHRFGRTPFEIACRAGVPIVSLTVECEPPYLSKEVPLHRPPMRSPVLRLGLLGVDDPASDVSDSRTLRRLVEERYRAWWRHSVAARSVYDPESKERSCQIISKTS